MIDITEAPTQPIRYNAVAGLPDMLLKAHSEIVGVVRRLRAGRDALNHATADKLQHTTAKLQEVSSATEVAANGILDGLDRATALVDELDAIGSTDEARAAAARAGIRDELFQAIGCLQFQDITSQQLNYAASILVEMEARLADLAEALDPNTAEAVTIKPEAVKLGAFDPGASVHGAEGRQALADSIFQAP